MKHILVYLNIPWNFIKQRPQFMAEKISQHFDVLVYYNKPYKNTYLVQNEKESERVNLVDRPKIPRKNNILKQMDNQLQKLFLKKYIRDYDLIWIMHPEQYEIMKNQLTGKKLIYDCMDDYSQFPHLSQKQKGELEKVEKDLVERADYIFYTSKTLQNAHQDRYNIIKNTHVVNNGFEPKKDIEEDKDVKEYLNNISGEKVVYIGAIAKWFDIQLIEQILRKDKEINVILFGPLEIELPNIERLHYFGKIPHSSTYTAMKYADLLIMPFIINKLIQAVDPIKVYEYIYSGKQVLVPNYFEMEKFKDYVTIYEDTSDCIEWIKKLKGQTQVYDLERFKEHNTWHARAKQVVNIINEDR